MTLSERCAIVFYLGMATIRFVELGTLRINQYGPPYVFYRTGMVLEDTVLALVFPFLALATVRATDEMSNPRSIEDQSEQNQ